MTRQLPRVFFAAAIAVLPWSCGEEPQKPPAEGFNISADDTLLGASVTVDNQRIGELQHLVTHGAFFGWLLKLKTGDSPAFHIVALNCDARAAHLAAGKHVIRIEKSGRPVASGEFVYPFSQPVAFFVVSGPHVEQLPSSNR